MSLITKIAENKNFAPTVAVLWGVTIVLLMHNTYLSIKINKKKLEGTDV